jgi:hypothetical protein
MKRLVIVFILLGIFSSSNAVNAKDDDHTNKHNHHHSEWELGVALGGVYLISEKEIAPGIHLHILRRLPKFERFSIGFGLESVFDEHTHFNAAIVGKVDLFKNFSAIVSPGILFLKESNGWSKHFSSHFELLYEFQVGKIHLGPVLEYSYSKYDKHIMLGVHVGYSF